MGAKEQIMFQIPHQQQEAYHKRKWNLKEHEAYKSSHLTCNA
jgi:hypothetical protein